MHSYCTLVGAMYTHLAFSLVAADFFSILMMASSNNTVLPLPVGAKEHDIALVYPKNVQDLTTDHLHLL